MFDQYSWAMVSAGRADFCLPDGVMPVSPRGLQEGKIAIQPFTSGKLKDATFIFSRNEE